MPFTPEELAYFSGQHLGRIATASASGTPDVAPVTFTITDAGAVEIHGLDLPKTLKWKNALATGKAAFVIDDLATTDPWRPRGVKVRGRVDADMSGERPVMRIHPEVIWSWGINPDAAKHFAGMIERRTVSS